jgi:hypothetical protein
MIKREAIKYGMTLFDYYESTPRDLFNFLKAKREKQKEDHEVHLNYIRYLMWASIQPHSTKEVRFSDLLKSGEAKVIELSPEDKKAVDDWAAECDKEMIAAGLLKIDNG